MEYLRRPLLTLGNGVRLALCEPETLIDRLGTAAELRRLRGQTYSSSNHPVEPHWYEALHEVMRMPQPCDAAGEFAELWSTIKTSLAGGGEGPGEKFDADTSLARAAWCTVRHARPQRVVETGVARGVTSWIILEALARNDAGHLWSIDLPRLEWAFNAGDGVPSGLRSRWTYLRGSSQRLLPRLVNEIGTIDFFVHDSLHTERNVRFELETVWPALTDAGLMIVDDIDDRQAYGSGLAFRSFICSRRPRVGLVAPQEEKGGRFGIIAKGPRPPF